MPTRAKTRESQRI